MEFPEKKKKNKNKNKNKLGGKSKSRAPRREAADPPGLGRPAGNTAVDSGVEEPPELFPTKVTLKLIIDQTGKRVPYAEAGKDFVDFLFTILTLPAGTVVDLLGAKQMAGCLGDLYQSIETLSSTYMQPNQTTKSSVLKPRALLSSANPPPLLPSTAYSSSSSSDFYMCNDNYNISTCRNYVAEDPNSVCPSCGDRMGRKAIYVASPGLASSTRGGDEGGFVRGVVTYMVRDDLVVEPMSTISSVTMLNRCHVKDLGSLQEKVVEMGLEEAMDLLEASFKSKTVLTDVFFNKK